ncbi:MAG: leucine--tRNA ligase [Puniceicoccales bacterium]|jgi:leucyl-tRNA synthetase|nr:leucine--tRNA ligase [Puniceicoccales bacterium]
MPDDTKRITTEDGTAGAPPQHGYDHAAIELRWQEKWLKDGTFLAHDPGTDANPSGASRPKYYVLDMFPYPSAAGLHIGHPEGYTASDILARYKRARGHNVLHPMGWDAFGLPTEEHARKTGLHPAVQTTENINNFRRQLRMLGFAVDWTREVNTTDPAYFKWTQWIFLQLFKHGLAYVDEKPVWFCPALGTVLANEEVQNTDAGPRSERGSHPVERRPMRQWVLRITAYAEKLIAGLDALNWPDSTKRLQKNWIGRSEGAEVVFQIADAPDASALTVYTTRPDTLFGATYMVIAPEHPQVPSLTTSAQRATVEAYLAQVRTKSDLERAALAKDKTGVFSGSHAINPVNGARIPIWIADYVLMGYGTGAIMAVPAHDQRDWDFARKYDLPVIPVVAPPPGATVDLEKSVFEADGTLVNSGPYDGLTVAEAKHRITESLATRAAGKAAVNYKLRDWLFSRQRYWGEPFPILWISPADYARIPENSPFREFLPKEPVSCRIEGKERYALPLATAHLPLRLPEIATFQPSPTGESPLSRASEWLNVRANLETGEILTADAGPSGFIDAIRETNTMPQWAGSCWYYLRYIDPKNPKAPVDPAKANYWGTPDFYIGGAEHAVLHLLYARFWHRFLYDIGVVPTPEPFQRLFHQGIILGEDGEKMSKSRGNVVNPDEIVRDYGADALRLYLMFLGPLEAAKPWNTKNIRGVINFLRRIWRLYVDENTGAVRVASDDVSLPEDFLRLHHRSIQKVTEDLESLNFNTAISQLMIHLNAAEKLPSAIPVGLACDHLRLLAPLAPHIAEELWWRVNRSPKAHSTANSSASIVEAGWPVFDPGKLVEDSRVVIFQVGGKLRGQATLGVDATREDLLAAARADENVRKFIAGRTIVKEIVVPGKLVNFVVKD